MQQKRKRSLSLGSPFGQSRVKKVENLLKKLAEELRAIAKLECGTAEDKG